LTPPIRRFALCLFQNTPIRTLASSVNFSYAFDALSYAIYANVSQRLSEAPRIAKRFSGTSAHKNALTPKTDPLSRLQILIDNVLSFRIYKIILQDSLHLLRIMRLRVYRNNKETESDMSRRNSSSLQQRKIARRNRIIVESVMGGILFSISIFGLIVLAYGLSA